MTLNIKGNALTTRKSEEKKSQVHFGRVNQNLWREAEKGYVKSDKYSHFVVNIDRPIQFLVCVIF